MKFFGNKKPHERKVLDVPIPPCDNRHSGVFGCRSPRCHALAGPPGFGIEEPSATSIIDGSSRTRVSPGVKSQILHAPETFERGLTSISSSPISPSSAKCWSSTPGCSASMMMVACFNAVCPVGTRATRLSGARMAAPPPPTPSTGPQCLKSDGCVGPSHFGARWKYLSPSSQFGDIENGVQLLEPYELHTGSLLVWEGPCGNPFHPSLFVWEGSVGKSL